VYFCLHCLHPALKTLIFWLLRVKDQDGFAFTSPSPAFTVEALSQGFALAGEGSEGKMQA